MSVVSITIQDESSPIELQAWFDANPSATIFQICNDGRTFLIFYT